MAINLVGYSLTPLGQPLREPIRFTCIGVVANNSNSEVLVGAESTLIPATDGKYSASLGNGIYMIEVQQGSKEWVEQGKVIVDTNTTTPISIIGLLKQYPYVPVE